jgi:nucleolar pre-ribosomal-associated protein 2
MVRLVQVVMAAWIARGASSDDFSNEFRNTTKEFMATFRMLLLSNLKRRLQKPEKLTNDDNYRCMSLYSTLDALDVVGVNDGDLADLQIDPRIALVSLDEWNTELEKRFEVFVYEHHWIKFDELSMISLGGDITSLTGRQAIRKKAKAVTEYMSELEKLQLVIRMLDEQADEHALDKLLALKHVIVTCEGQFTHLVLPSFLTRPDSRSITPDNSDDTTLSLSSAYSVLAAQLQRAGDVLQFCFISEIMEMILRNKVDLYLWL